MFVTRRGGGEVLLVHRAPEDGDYWHVVAGGVERGENTRNAAERELREETGLVAVLADGVGVTEYVHPLIEEPADQQARHDPSVVEVQVDCFLVEAPPRWEPTLNSEHDAYRWCKPAEAVASLRWPATAQALLRLLE